ncbi:hypothetical protein Anae109_4227 [Anaeromyxobacter sp. Fw109-5]|nr:hypothetical protein Anae109_4227 [Anaeromyxobacter sp. Fw109-5]
MVAPGSGLRLSGDHIGGRRDPHGSPLLLFPGGASSEGPRADRPALRSPATRNGGDDARGAPRRRAPRSPGRRRPSHCDTRRRLRRPHHRDRNAAVRAGRTRSSPAWPGPVRRAACGGLGEAPALRRPRSHGRISCVGPRGRGVGHRPSWRVRAAVPADGRSRRSAAHADQRRRRDAFVSADLFGSFGRHAVSQLGKLARSARLAEHRDLVLDWLREEPPPDLDAVAARLAQISPRPAPTKAAAILAAKEYVKQLYRSLHDLGVVEANDFASLVRYARDGGKQPEPARELRPKNAYNLLRLIHVATGWLRTGAPELEMQGAVRDRLLAVKRGEVGLDAMLTEAEALVPALEAARDATRPRRPDLDRADALFRRVAEEVARRWLERVPGPFGADAPPAPAVREVSS